MEEDGAMSRDRRDVIAVLCGLVWVGGFLPSEVVAAPPAAAKQTPVAKAPAIDPEHPLAPALEHAYQARSALAEIRDYSATFSKRELIGGELKAASMNLKLREEPFSVYLHFGKPNEGREVIYVAGRNNNQLFVHDTGLSSLVGTISLVPDGERAMAENRYPVTMIGLREMLNRVIAQWEAEGEFAETNVKYYPNAKLGMRECRVIESTHPQPRKQFKFHMTRLFIDKESGLAVRVEQYGFPANGGKPPLIEEYSYLDIRTNLGFKDADFDTKNPNYAFP
jgi:hypothetical protein